MGVLEKTIQVSLVFNNRQYYADRGYAIDPRVKKLNVSTGDCHAGPKSSLLPYVTLAVR